VHPSAKRLKGLIGGIRRSVANGGMTAKEVEDGIGDLIKIDSKYCYDDDKFPPLRDAKQWSNGGLESPTNLAEALLWKMGKWKAYKSFAAYYSSGNSEPSTDSAVFYAFAKHLRDRKEPIFDQHSLRALWAIRGNWDKDAEQKCKKFLFSKKCIWKEAGSGPTAYACYQLFRESLLSTKRVEVTADHLDQLLMPLGRAIKKCTDNYDDFGWLRKD